MSAAFYNHVPQAMYRSWVAEHSSNGMVSFLLHNRLRLRRRNHTLPMNDQSLQRAQAFLATFDAVGRTEDLSAFYPIHSRASRQQFVEHQPTFSATVSQLA